MAFLPPMSDFTLKLVTLMRLHYSANENLSLSTAYTSLFFPRELARTNEQTEPVLEFFMCVHVCFFCSSFWGMNDLVSAFSGKTLVLSRVDPLGENRMRFAPLLLACACLCELWKIGWPKLFVLLASKWGEGQANQPS